ncbi:MAG: hypothetical protein KR126chlam3_00438 [Chlamydiae bacterium]|nr:hypothetical protein [Chlamydiota bacterium]
MLKPLFGSNSVSQILLFILVNEECYAHQLQRVLGLSVTPAQKALARLETGGILKSCYRGKVRVYAFHPEYPLLSELATLLKKAYNQLSLEEKKRYYYLPYEQKKEKKQVNDLLKSIWEHMRIVTQMTLIARSRKDQKSAYTRKGKGNVLVEDRGQSLIFQENGTWQKDQGGYQNRFRWSWNRPQGLLTLEHLRFGEANPVFLFDLYATGGNTLESLSPHLHGDDTYFGWMEYKGLFLHLHIRTLGPKKDEKIEYAYV